MSFLTVLEQEKPLNLILVHENLILEDVSWNLTIIKTLLFFILCYLK